MNDFSVPSPATPFSGDSLLSLFDNLSPTQEKFRACMLAKEKLLGELWHERLCSDPSAQKLAAEAEARTGDPMAYYKGLAAMYVNSVPKTPETASSTLARLDELEAQMKDLALLNQQERLERKAA